MGIFQESEALAKRIPGYGDKTVEGRGNYLRAMTLLVLGAEVLGDRENMSGTFTVAKENPRHIVHLLDELEVTIEDINTDIKNRAIHPAADYAKQLGTLCRATSLPQIYSESVLDDSSCGIHTFSSLRRMREFMKTGEEFREYEALPASIKSSKEFMFAHIQGKDPVQNIAAIMVHGYDIFVTTHPVFRRYIELDTVANAVCEYVALLQPQSVLFQQFKALNWYTPHSGFSESLLTKVAPYV